MEDYFNDIINRAKEGRYLYEKNPDREDLAFWDRWFMPDKPSITSFKRDISQAHTDYANIADYLDMAHTLLQLEEAASKPSLIGSELKTKKNLQTAGRQQKRRTGSPPCPIVQWYDGRLMDKLRKNMLAISAQYPTMKYPYVQVFTETELVADKMAVATTSAKQLNDIVKEYFDMLQNITTEIEYQQWIVNFKKAIDSHRKDIIGKPVVPTQTMTYKPKYGNFQNRLYESKNTPHRVDGFACAIDFFIGPPCAAYMLLMLGELSGSQLLMENRMSKYHLLGAKNGYMDKIDPNTKIESLAPSKSGVARKLFHDSEKKPVPGELMTLAVNIMKDTIVKQNQSAYSAVDIPSHRQKAPTVTYSGNWFDTKYYSSGKVISIVSADDGIYNVLWHGIIKTATATDFKQYSVGERVAIILDIGGFRIAPLSYYN